MRFLFILFLVIPVVEIYFLITVGSAIGAVTTVALILLTAFIGAFLVRAQGFSTLARVQMQMAKGEMPAIEIFEGLFLLVAGALLLTPGFITDAIGFACLTKIVLSMVSFATLKTNPDVRSCYLSDSV